MKRWEAAKVQPFGWPISFEVRNLAMIGRSMNYGRIISVSSGTMRTISSKSLPPSPAPVLQNPDILEILDPTVNLPYPVFEFLRLMDEVMEPVDGEQSAVVDFAFVLLQELGYTSVGTKTPRNLRRRKEIPFLICGENRHTQADVCVLDYTNSITSISLVVHAAKRHREDGREPIPELVAMEIAAFHSNNPTRQRMDLPKNYPGHYDNAQLADLL
ncbi:hypothetical protein MSAN_02236600 [Mycena sanguinolenta]|uniref:Uncharacterized protein n=1 Tax=Mycena sanguinolenta TaxID=230812 RepID=A0A8H7CJG8_9AGAR|nr:hypothetical protein MSAN_02236600 [Mycena sanguinolenta]